MDQPEPRRRVLNSNRKHGLVEIDWGPADPEIHLEIYDRARLYLDHVVRLSELKPDVG